MFCTDTCHKQPLGEVLHSVEICFVTSLLKSLFHDVLNYSHILSLNLQGTNAKLYKVFVICLPLGYILAQCVCRKHGWVHMLIFQCFISRGRNSVTAWPLVPALQVAVVSVTFHPSTVHPGDQHKKGIKWAVNQNGIQLTVYGLKVSQISLFNQSAITNRFTHSLESFKPNSPFAVFGHGFVRTTQTAVTIVPVPQTHEITTLWEIQLYPAGIFILKPDLIFSISPSINASTEIVWDLSTSLFNPANQDNAVFGGFSSLGCW